jgi:hypothetical protein
MAPKDRIPHTVIILLGLTLCLLSVYALIGRARFMGRSEAISARVMRVQSHHLWVAPEGRRSAAEVRFTRFEYYRVGQTVPLRIDTTGTTPGPIVGTAYINRFRNIWLEPIAALVVGLVLTGFGLRTRRR